MRKTLIAFFLCLSVAAVEEVSQTVDTRMGVDVVFPLTGINSGRGGEAISGRYWTVRQIWQNLGTLDRVFTKLSSPENQVQYNGDFQGLGALLSDFTSWNDAQEKPLYFENVSVVISAQPSSGVLAAFAASEVDAPAGDGPRFKFTPEGGFVGSVTATITYKDGSLNDLRSVLLTINVNNDAPSIAVQVSPSLILAGGEVAISPTTSDPNNHTVSVSYDYGDGQTGTSTTHTYAAPGVYTVTATANDGFGGTATAQTTVTVVGTDHIPTARFTTSDVVAFVNIPFVFDATTSTDPQNGALIYAWSFGDNTPNGAQAIQPHVYTQTGALTVTLTVTDAEGFTSIITREIEVLEESAAATFDSEIRVETTYFPLRANKDTLSIFARVNIGDTQLVDGSAVALEYAGKRYAANLNKRGKAVGWTVKQNLRRQAPGTVEVRFKVRNTAIASLLSQLGAVNDADIDIPFRLELGAKTIEIDVPTLFEVGVARGKGVGELE